MRVRGWLRRANPVVAAIFGAILAKFHRILFDLSGIFSMYGHGGHDFVNQFYPWRVLIHAHAEGVFLPYWNSYTFMGLPLLPNIQIGLFSPLNTLFFFLPTNVAANYTLVLYFAIAGIGMYALLREYQIQPTGAAIGGVAFMLSDALVARVAAGHLPHISVIAFVPVTFLAYERARRENSMWSIAIAGVAVAIQVMSGHVQFAHHTLVAVFIYTITLEFINFREDPKRIAVRTFRIFAGSGVIAVGVAAVQLAPTLYFTQFSVRTAGLSLSEAAVHTFTPARLITGIIPNFIGRTGFYWEESFYVGIIPLLLAIVALDTIRNNPKVLAYSTVGLVSFVLALGPVLPIYTLYFRAFPLADTFRIPGRYMVFVSFSLAALAGFGYRRLRKQATIRRRIWGALSIIVVVELTALASVIGLFVLGWRSAVSVPYESVLSGLVTTMVTDTVLSVLLTVIAIAILYAIRKKPEQDIIRYVLLAIVIVNLLWHPSPLVGSTDVDTVYSDPGYPTTIEGRVYDSEMLLFDSGAHYGSLANSKILRENQNIVYKTESVGGYNPLNLQNAFTRLQELDGPVADEEKLDVFNVSHVIAPKGRPYESNNYSVVKEINETHVLLKNEDVYSKAIFIPEVKKESTLFRGDSETREDTYPLKGGPNSYTLDVQPPRSGYVLVTYNWYPFWYATVDGEPVEVEQSNAGFLAIPVDKTDQTVTLRYRPTAWYIGGGVTLLTVFGLVLWTAKRARSR